MDLISIAEQFYDPFVAQYADQLLPGHRTALNGECHPALSHARFG